MDPFGRPDNRHVRLKNKKDDDDEFQSILFADRRPKKKPTKDMNEDQMINGRRSLGVDKILPSKNVNSVQPRTQTREQPRRPRQQNMSKKQPSTRSTHSSSRQTKTTSIPDNSQKSSENTPLNFPFDTTNLEECRKWNTLLQSTFNTKDVSKDDLRRFIRVIKKSGGLNAFIEKETNNYYSSRNVSSHQTSNNDKNMPTTTQQVHQDFETSTLTRNSYGSKNKSSMESKTNIHKSRSNSRKDNHNISTHVAKPVEGRESEMSFIERFAAEATHVAKPVDGRESEISFIERFAAETTGYYTKQLDSSSLKSDGKSTSDNILSTIETNNDEEANTSGDYKQSAKRAFIEHDQSLLPPPSPLSAPSPPPSSAPTPPPRTAPTPSSAPPPPPPPPPPITAPTSTPAFQSNTSLKSEQSSTITEAVKNVQLTKISDETKDNSSPQDINEAIKAGIKLRKLTEEDKSKSINEKNDDKHELCDLLAFQVKNLRERMRMSDFYSLEGDDDSWDDD